MIAILDNGHGGMIGGQYQTPGKRSPEWDLGVLYEGAFNRWITNRIQEELDNNNVPYFQISPEPKDISLRSRVNRANAIWQKNHNTYVVSIHANAGGGQGMEIFTSKGQTGSDKLATKFMQAIKNGYPDTRIRADYSDGDIDKEADFYILRNTRCAAILLELGFMDNQEDYRRLFDQQWRDGIAKCIAGTITEIFKIQNLQP